MKTPRISPKGSRSTYSSLEEATHVEILRTAQVTMRWAWEALRPFKLTGPQFNVLRILRGARPEPLKACVISERMVSDDPDLTRLLDRLEAAGYVEKSRDEQDRRAMRVGITREGLALVEKASEAVRARLVEGFGGMGRKKLNALCDLLEECREARD